MTDSHGSYVSSLKRHRWTFFSIFFSYTALFGLMGMRVPHIETLKPSNLNHSLISHLCLSIIAHSHLYLSPSSPSATTLCSLNHSLPFSHSASSPSATMSCPDRSSLTQSLFTSLSLCLVAISHHELPKSQLTLSITLCLSLTLPHHCRSRSHSLPFFNFNSFRLYSCKILYPF